MFHYKKGMAYSNPVQEIHDHVDHDLHGPLGDGPHRHAKGPLRHPKAFAWCPLLQELVDPVGERLSEGLLAVPHADMARRGPSCAIKKQSVLPFRRDEAGNTPAFAQVSKRRLFAAL